MISLALGVWIMRVFSRTNSVRARDAIAGRSPDTINMCEFGGVDSLRSAAKLELGSCGIMDERLLKLPIQNERLKKTGWHRSNPPMTRDFDTTQTTLFTFNSTPK